MCLNLCSEFCFWKTLRAVLHSLAVPGLFFPSPTPPVKEVISLLSTKQKWKWKMIFGAEGPSSFSYELKKYIFMVLLFPHKIILWLSSSLWAPLWHIFFDQDGIKKLWLFFLPFFTDAHILSRNDLILGGRLWDPPKSGKIITVENLLRSWSIWVNKTIIIKYQFFYFKINKICLFS